MPMAAAAKLNNKNAAFDRATAKLLSEFQERRPLRTGSLLVSVFGDAIAPHGGSVWLGSLIRAFDAFGINQRLVRTTVFRLAKDGWLSSEQIGRRSYYTLTTQGRRRCADASRRIYSEPRKDWPGTWSLVLLSGVDTIHRDDLRKQLRWLGFAPFSANLMAHPAPDRQAVDEHLAELAGSDCLLTMQSHIDEQCDTYLREVVHKSWELDDLGQRYGEFLEQFRPVYAAARRKQTLRPEAAFQARTLLIQEYRRVLLRDPMLPEALLPEGWDGVAAAQLCRNLYALLARPAEQFLMDEMETADGPLPPAEPGFYQRFGGLPLKAAANLTEA